MKKILMAALIMLYNVAFANIIPISKERCEKMISANTITEDNPVKCSRLKAVRFNYINFSGKEEQGEVVVLDVFAPQVESLFKELYLKKFPIKKALPLENYNGDDNASMADNNTSAFNGRDITNSRAITKNKWSKHAYGAAIDINPIQNPYLSFPETGMINVKPKVSYDIFTNRLNNRPGKHYRPGLSEEVREIFFSHGFLRWGGYWDSPIDYQHFEVGSIDYINSLLDKPFNEAILEFAAYGKGYSDCMQKSTANNNEVNMNLCVEKTLK